MPQPSSTRCRHRERGGSSEVARHRRGRLHRQRRHRRPRARAATRSPSSTASSRGTATPCPPRSSSSRPTSPTVPPYEAFSRATATTGCSTSRRCRWSASRSRTPSATSPTTPRARSRWSARSSPQACRAWCSPRPPRPTASPRSCPSPRTRRPGRPTRTAPPSWRSTSCCGSPQPPGRCRRPACATSTSPGAHGDIGERHTVETHLIPNVLAVPGGKRDAVDVFGNDYPTPDGSAVRDYIHVVDLANAHVRALETATEPGPPHLQPRSRPRLLRPRGHRDRPLGDRPPGPRTRVPASCR